MAGVPQGLKGRSFTRVAAWSHGELETLLDLADELKAARAYRRELRLLPGRTIGLIFHKPSTRTRVAFEVGISELGGMALFLPAELKLARGESYRDTAAVLSRLLSALMIRTFDQAEVEEFAEHASIPVINGLTDEYHPLQALADTMTMRERFGTLAGIHTPMPGRAWARKRIGNAGFAISLLTVYPSLLALADTDAVALHCLPAHVGEEIAAEVLRAASHGSRPRTVCIPRRR